MVHAQHALQQGMKKLEVWTVDTGIMIILFDVFYDIIVIQPLADTWVAFEVGINYRFLGTKAFFRP